MLLNVPGLHCDDAASDNFKFFLVLVLVNYSFAMSATETMTEKAQSQIDELADKQVDSTDSELRYMAYGARLRTALRAGTRYIAYVWTTHFSNDTNGD